MDFMVGSTNLAKVQAAKEVIGIHFTDAFVTGIETNSGVSSQPYGDEETRLGAINRAMRASKSKKDAIGIGLEGGVRLLEDKMYICNWGALVYPDGRRLTAGGAQIPLPEAIAEEIRAGKELGPVIEAYFNLIQVKPPADVRDFEGSQLSKLNSKSRRNPAEERLIKKGLREKEGAMGMLTNGAVTRVDLFSHILQLLIGQMKAELTED